MRKTIFAETESPLSLHPNRVTEYVATTRRHDKAQLNSENLTDMRKSGIFRRLNFSCGYLTRSNDAYTLRFASLPSTNWIIFVKREE